MLPTAFIFWLIEMIFLICSNATLKLAANKTSRRKMKSQTDSVLVNKATNMVAQSALSLFSCNYPMSQPLWRATITMWMFFNTHMVISTFSFFTNSPGFIEQLLNWVTGRNLLQLSWQYGAKTQNTELMEPCKPPAGQEVQIHPPCCQPLSPSPSSSYLTVFADIFIPDWMTTAPWFLFCLSFLYRLAASQPFV